MWELQQAGEKSVTLHCAPNGNYEPLQCEDGWCYCIDPATATPYGSRLPEGVMDRLDCCECLDVFVCMCSCVNGAALALFCYGGLGIGSVIYIFSYRFFFYSICSSSVLFILFFLLLPLIIFPGSLPFSNSFFSSYYHYSTYFFLFFVDDKVKTQKAITSK